LGDYGQVSGQGRPLLQGFDSVAFPLRLEQMREAGFVFRFPLN
jgi:hypothetical protein